MKLNITSYKEMKMNEGPSDAQWTKWSDEKKSKWINDHPTSKYAKQKDTGNGGASAPAPAKSAEPKASASKADKPIQLRKPKYKSMGRHYKHSMEDFDGFNMRIQLTDPSAQSSFKGAEMDLKSPEGKMSIRKDTKNSEDEVLDTKKSHEDMNEIYSVLKATNDWDATKKKAEELGFTVKEFGDRAKKVDTSSISNDFSSFYSDNDSVFHDGDYMLDEYYEDVLVDNEAGINDEVIEAFADNFVRKEADPEGFASAIAELSSKGINVEEELDKLKSTLEDDWNL